ncbi:hypothetical protein SAMN02745857_02748 [Andreprevotia lacus DSM 23236]|jgi:hypothetical protein|uniref:Uncharacterized protein n=1 Tax=Andreprevotia lacus DSM 23236 TaxID=1121001 RepID=A0A1W1XTL9_9NEIS|nr:hypothetical protein [Andreprevotia lacus]SMC27195.1 hypothetical protein SAMN02745857_02748 [Andreprevotia lacus DSM 23236]
MSDFGGFFDDSGSDFWKDLFGHEPSYGSNSVNNTDSSYGGSQTYIDALAPLTGGADAQTNMSFFGSVGSALGGAYDWYKSQDTGAKGLINAAILGGVQAWNNARAADAQRDYQRQMTQEARDELRRYRTVPKDVALGTASNFGGK